MTNVIKKHNKKAILKKLPSLYVYVYFFFTHKHQVALHYKALLHRKRIAVIIYTITYCVTCDKG